MGVQSPSGMAGRRPPLSAASSRIPDGPSDEAHIVFYRQASLRTTVQACRTVTEPGFVRLYNAAGDEVATFPADVLLCVTRRSADVRRDRPAEGAPE